MLSPDDYPLPSAFDHAYADASTVVFETDIRALHTPAFQQKLLAELMFRDGQQLADTLSSSTYMQLQTFLEARQMTIGQFMLFKPALISLSLTVMELHRLGLDAVGVDQHFSLLAERDQKKFGQMETVDDQIHFLATMADGCEDSLVAFTLRDLVGISATVGDMRRFWRNGDIPALERVALQGMTTEFPSIHDSLLVSRNQAWLPQITAMIASEGTEFVLVGALHLAGPEGLLAQLQQQGYSLQQLD